MNIINTKLTPGKLETELRKFVSEDSIRENLMHIHNDGKNIVVTDGLRLISIDLDVYPVYQPIGKKIDNYPEWKALTETNEDLYQEIDLSDFIVPDSEVKMIQTYVKEACPVCDGYKECKCCGRDCEECDGEGLLPNLDKPLGKEPYFHQFIEINESRFRLVLSNSLFKFWNLFGLKKGIIKSDLRKHNHLFKAESEGVTIVLMPMFKNESDSIIKSFQVPFKDSSTQTP
jgi:hypothetical protein